MSITLHTSVGDIKIELAVAETPQTAENFLALAASEYYDNTLLHRSIPGFLLQGGDPTGTGTGGECVWGGVFADEIVTTLSHATRGVVAMANAGPDSNGSQFYITYAPQPQLDGSNTVFGKVIDGFDVLDAIERVPVDPKTDKPLIDISILSTTIHANPIADAAL